MTRLSFLNYKHKNKTSFTEELFGYSVVFYIFTLLIEELLPGLLSYTFFVTYFFFIPGFLIILLIFSEYVSERSNFYIYKQAKVSRFILIFLLLVAAFLFTHFFVNSAFHYTYGYFILITISFFWMLVMYLFNEKKLSKKFIFLAHFLLVVALASVSIWNYFVPFGVLRFTTGIKESGHVQEYKTAGDLVIGEDTLGAYRLVDSSEIDLTIDVPRAFKEAEVEVVYNTSINTQINLAAQHANSYYSRHTLNSYSSILEEMPFYWHIVEESGDYILYEKNQEQYGLFVDSIEKLQVYLEKADEIKEDQKNEIIVKYEAKSINFQRYQQLIKEIEQEYKFAIDEITHYNLNFQTSTYSPSYTSIQNFINQKELDYTSVLNYQTSLDPYFKLGESNTVITHETELNTRGGMTLLFYKFDDAPLEVDFWYSDSNKHEDSDDINLFISQGGISLGTSNLKDDDNDSTDNIISDFKDIRFSQKNLPKGLYRLQIKTSDDIFFKKVTSNAAFVYEGSYYSAESSYYDDIEKTGDQNIILYTNSTNLLISTAHEKSLGIVKVDNSNFSIDRTHKEFEITELSGVTRVEIGGDMKVRGDGVFTFKESSPLLRYKNNVVNTLTTYEDIDSYNFIYAKYIKPEMIDGWNVSRVKVTVPDISFSNNQASFKIIFDKGIAAGNIIKIKEINITFIKDPLTIRSFVDKVKSYISN